MEEEIVKAFAPKLRNRHASAPKIAVKYYSLSNFSTVFSPSLCPHLLDAFAPKIKEEKWLY